MKRLLFLLTFGAVALAAQIIPPSAPVAPAQSVTGLIPVPPSPTPTPAEIVAQAIVDGINAQVPARVAALKNIWETLWENPRATPQEIFDVLGSNGGLVLLGGQLAVQDITAIATAINTTPEALLGDAKYLTTKFPVVIDESGNVTVQPLEP